MADILTAADLATPAPGTPISAPDEGPTGCAKASTPLGVSGHDQCAANPVNGAEAGECLGENSAVDGNSRSHSQPGANAADPRHTHSDTAGPSLSAVEAGEPCPPNPGSPACHSETATAPSAEPVGDHCSGRGTSAEPDGSAAFPSPACPKTARGNSQEALAPAAFLADLADSPPQGGGQLRAASEPPASSVVDALLVSPPALTEKRERALRALLARPMSARKIEQAISGAAGICSGPLRKIGWAEYRDSQWHITSAGRRALGLIDAPKEIPSETSAATPQGADAPGITDEGSAPAGAEGVGEDGAEPSKQPAEAAPEEAEGSSGSDAAAGESPAPSLVPPPDDPTEGLAAQDEPPLREAGPEVALPRCDGDEEAGARPQQSSQAKPAPEPAGEEPLPDARTDPDPLPARQPDPIDAARPAVAAAERARIDVRHRPTDPEWAPILDRVDAGERPDVVALDEGVDIKELQGQLRARLAARAAAARQDPPSGSLTKWTPEKDLALVQGIIRLGLGKTMAAMNLHEDDAKARWNELLPRKGLAEQTALLSRLRAQVEARA